ncbi:MAG: hypothetical protein PHS07_03445 [Patescibacteria group bacterium]|nr:hypothetical protein [Patescibacteria group bacterium]
MGNQETVQTMTAGQMKELTAALIEAVPADLTKAEAQKVVGSKEKIREAMERAIKEIVGNTTLNEWSRFYLEVFGLKIDFSNVLMPKPQGDIDFPICVAQGMTPNRLFEKMASRFASWRYIDNLNTITSIRKTDHNYIVLVRYRVEADKELKNFSANDLKAKNINVITLEERQILELFYHWKSGKHLDGENWTICAGSRYADGDVPGVGFCDGKVRVRYCVPSNSGEDLRGRQVVSI